MMRKEPFLMLKCRVGFGAPRPCPIRARTRCQLPHIMMDQDVASPLQQQSPPIATTATGRGSKDASTTKMLPEPALTLTLPSLHDSLVLDCRVYHPFSLAANPRAPPWQRHAAIVAHPYAPLGGSYDDPVVETVAAQLLRKGFLVGTFNFRCVLEVCL